MTEHQQKLQECISLERKNYSEYAFPSKISYWGCLLRKDPARRILQFLIVSRKMDYHAISKKSGRISSYILHFIYSFIKNSLGEKIGFEVSTQNISKGLMIYHYNVIINPSAIIGKNCHLHGQNCIGNKGLSGSKSPIIGNNVTLGVGAKVIGDLYIADNITIAAGAVVTKSFYEQGITIGGVPARKIK